MNNQSRTTTIRVSAFSVLACTFLMPLGCSDPLESVSKFEAPATDIVFSDQADDSKYEWQIKNNQYVVDKPPVMSSLRKLRNKFTFPDRTQSKLVPWDEAGLSDDAKQLLADAFDPSESKLVAKMTIPASQLTSTGSYGLARDGKRLITLEQKGIGLYDCIAGKRIGYMPLPDSLQEENLNSISFVGKTGDFLLWSSDIIARVSGKTGKVTASTTAHQAPIDHLDLSDDGRSLAVLTRSGEAYCGDTMLQTFNKLDLDAAATTISINPNGTRLAIGMSKSPHLYELKDYRLAKDLGVRFPNFTPSDQIQTVHYGNRVCWHNHLDMAVAVNRKNGYQHAYAMVWNPFALRPCSRIDARTKSDWLLVYGTRFKNDKLELVLYDFDPVTLSHSRASVLEGKLQFFSASDSGEVIVVKCKSKDVQVYDRIAWQYADFPSSSAKIRRIVSDLKLSEIERVCDIVMSQEKLGYGQVPCDLAHNIITDVGRYWKVLEQDVSNKHIPADDPRLTALNKWHESGSIWAMLASGSRYHMAAWKSGEATDKSTEHFQRNIKLAKQDFERAIAMPGNNLSAMAYRVLVGLETDETLPDIDDLFGRAMTAFPDNATLPSYVAFHLQPYRRHAERGDMIDFCIANSRLTRGPASDLQFAIVFASVARYIDLDERASARSFDNELLKRGIREWIRQGRRTNPEDAWMMIKRVQKHRVETEIYDEAFANIAATQAAFPNLFSTHHMGHGNYNFVRGCMMRMRANRDPEYHKLVYGDQSK